MMQFVFHGTASEGTSTWPEEVYPNLAREGWKERSFQARAGQSVAGGILARAGDPIP